MFILSLTFKFLRQRFPKYGSRPRAACLEGLQGCRPPWKM